MNELVQRQRLRGRIEDVEMLDLCGSAAGQAKSCRRPISARQKGMT